MMRFEEIRVLEWNVLGHGPLWLGFMLEPLSRIASRVSVWHPDHPSYDSLEALRRELPPRSREAIRLQRHPGGLGEGTLPELEAMARALEPGADLVLITMLDQLLDWEGASRVEVPRERPLVWGIWFGPWDPAQLRPPRWRRLVSRAARRRQHAWQMQKTPPAWLDGAFFLDASLAARVELGGCTALLPDPWPSCPRLPTEEARHQLGLPADRTLFLHAGVAHARKGLSDCIAAFERADHSGVLVRVGPTDARDRRRLTALGRRGRAIIVDQRVPSEQLDAYLRACDWVLLPYRAHESSSGFLAGAAAAQRPVIATDFGLLGRRVRQRRLGLVFEPGSGAALTQVLEAAMRESIDRFRSDLDAFAASSSPQTFSESLLTTLAASKGRRLDEGAGDTRADSRECAETRALRGR